MEQNQIFLLVAHSSTNAFKQKKVIMLQLRSARSVSIRFDSRYSALGLEENVTFL